MRLTAYSATGVDAWLKAIARLNQDTLMSNAAFRTTLSMRLGIAIFETGLACSFCHQNLDPQGHHITTYMGDGHKQLMHSWYFLSQCCDRLAQRVRAQPKLEPTGLTHQQSPTAPCGYLNYWPSGYPHLSWKRFPRVTLDCTITSPFQHQTQQIADSSPLGSGIRYADLKRSHLDMKQQCKQILAFNQINVPIFDVAGFLILNILISSDPQSWWFCKRTNKQTNKRTNEQTNKHRKHILSS